MPRHVPDRITHDQKPQEPVRAEMNPALLHSRIPQKERHACHHSGSPSLSFLAGAPSLSFPLQIRNQYLYGTPLGIRTLPMWCGCNLFLQNRCISFPLIPALLYLLRSNTSDLAGYITYWGVELSVIDGE